MPICHSLIKPYSFLGSDFFDLGSLCVRTCVVKEKVSFECYLVCGGSDNTNRKGEKKRNGASQQDTPPRQLERGVVIGASEENGSNVHHQEDEKPPHRHRFVYLHKPTVYIHLLTPSKGLFALIP